MLSRLLAQFGESRAARFCVGAAAILAGTAALHGAATVQDFSNPSGAGTPFALQQLGDAPAPLIQNGAAVVTSDSGGQRNYLVFEPTGISSAATPILFYFDYRMPTEAGHTGCCGERADGFGFALISTNAYGSTNTVGDIWGAVEQDAINGFTVGFDIFTGNGDGVDPTDNNVRIGWNGVTVANVAYGSAFKLNNGVWNRVRGKLTPSGADILLDLSITPAGSTTTVVFASQVIAGASIPQSRVMFAGRTGGAFTKVEIDNVEVYSDFPAADAATISTQPVNQSVTETYPASFWLGVSGTPPFSVQWYSNGVAIPGANSFGYSIPTTTTNMSGTFSATVSNAFTPTPIVSGNATLTVNPALLAISANARGQGTKVYVQFMKPVTLSGTYTLNNGATVSSVAYGANQNEVVLTTSLLGQNATYTLNILGETATDGSGIAPNPTQLTFFNGFGAFCSDFAAAPAGAGIFGSAGIIDDGTGTNNVLKITAAQNDQAGGFVISNMTGAASLDRLYASWKMYIGDGTCCGANFADGLSFNWAAALPFGTIGGAEEGTGTGLTVSFDTWDNAGGEAPAIDIKWGGVQVGHVLMPIVRNGTNFVPVQVAVNPNGTLSLNYDGIQVYNNLVLPGYAPIANSRVGVYARTGGANENAWLDNLCINNFNIGPVSITQNPANTTALAGNPATFSVGLDGTPPYYYQWLTNGVPVPGATGSTYTTAPTTAIMDNMQVSVIVSNDFSTATSAAGTLDVNTSPRVVSVFSPDSTHVRVVYTTPVQLDGTYEFNNGVFLADAVYGASHSEVVLTTDPALTPLVNYDLTITDVHSEGGGELLLPSPTVVSFHNGYGSVCYNFNDNQVPAGGQLVGTAAVTGGAVHITDAVNSLNNAFYLPDQNAGQSMDRLYMSWKQLLGLPAANSRIADGMSLSIGSNVGAALGASDGVGSGLIITMDTWDNNAPDTAPAFEVKYKGSVVAFQSMAGVREGNRANEGPLLLDGNGNPLSLETSNLWVNAVLSVGPDGKLSFWYKDVRVFNNLQLPNYTPFVGANYNFSANTGGANENAWIDDLCINSFALGAVTIAQQPANAEVNEPGRATFTVVPNGLPPYTYQWYSNGVAIAGATSYTYTTPVYDRVADGWQYRVVVANSEGSITSQVATLTFNRDTVAPAPLSAMADCLGNVYVVFSENVQAASAQTIGNYTINNGVAVNSATLISPRVVRLAVSPMLTVYGNNKLTVNGVIDSLGYNAVNNVTIPISAQNPATETSSGSGMFVIEAEDYDVNLTLPQTPASAWQVATALPGYSGSGYMDATPNTGAGGGDVDATFTNSTTLAYCINFATAGRYYVWARGSTANDGGNNSFHLGIDGVNQGTNSQRIGNTTNNWGGDAVNINAFGWVHTDFNNLPAFFDITAPGVHTVNIWMREDGIRLDKFIFTTNSAFNLAVADVGPSAVDRSSTPPISLAKAANGSVTITWPGGAGWTLQGASSLSNNPAATQWQDLPFPSGTVIPPGYFGTGSTNVFFRLRAP